MNRAEKAAVIEEVAAEIGASQAVFAVDYRGITVAQIGTLREKLRESDTTLRVVKNSLSERAAEQSGAEALKPLLVGPTALALVKGDAAAAAKALSDTSKALNGPLQFKGGIMDGALLSVDDVQAIAKLPSRDVLNAQLVGTIAAPLSGLVRTLNALISGLAIQLGQIAEQGLVSGTAPAPVADTSSEPPAASSSEPSATDAGEATVSDEAQQDVPDADEATASATEAEGPVATSADSDELAAGGSDEVAEDATNETETEGASDDSPSDE